MKLSKKATARRYEPPKPTFKRLKAGKCAGSATFGKQVNTKAKWAIKGRSDVGPPAFARMAATDYDNGPQVQRN